MHFPMNSPSPFVLFSTSGSRIPRLIKLGLTLGLSALFTGAAVGAPYAFTTRAGDALVAGSTDGTGSAAHFNLPTGVAVDSAGTVYVADQYNHTIRKLTTAGVATTLAGTAGSPGSADGTGSAARFNFPIGLTVDGSGNVYVTDRANQTIRKITSGGVVTTLAGAVGIAGSTDGTGSSARFNFPIGVAVDGTGTVYVADRGNHTIRKITSGGVVTTLAGTVGAAGSANGTGSAARFDFPTGLVADSAGNLFVADHYNDTIRKIASGGVVTTLAGLAGSSGSVDGTGSTARFNAPTGLAVDNLGNIYVADRENHTIRKITSGGEVTTLGGTAGTAGANDGIGIGAGFFYPFAVAVDSAGRVYVADTAGNTIRSGVAWTPALSDLDGDDRSDILWSNTTTGERSLWQMNGTVLAAGAVIGTVPVQWRISATGDFNGDGKGDLFWTNTSTGDRAAWLMNGATITQNTYLSVVPAAWAVSGTGDFNGDGKDDILWTNTATGDRAMWFMNGGAVLGGGFLTNVPLVWQIRGTGDYNGDGKSDILWSNTTTGERSLWLMNGTVLASGAVLGTVPTEWSMSASEDYNGDGKADIFWTNTRTGDRAMWLMNGATIANNLFLSTVPVSWAVSGAGDYNGDGKADVLWTNTVTGDRAMWFMSGGTMMGGGFLTTVPLVWEIAP